MNDKLSVKKMTIELDSLRNRIRNLELKLESALSQVLLKLKGIPSDTRNNTLPNMDELVISVISNEYRRELIAKAAYLRAERRGFAGGSPEQDWLEAEEEVDHYLMERKIPEAREKTATQTEHPGMKTETRKLGTLSLNRP